MSPRSSDMSKSIRSGNLATKQVENRVVEMMIKADSTETPQQLKMMHEISEAVHEDSDPSHESLNQKKPLLLSKCFSYDETKYASGPYPSPKRYEYLSARENESGLLAKGLFYDHNDMELRIEKSHSKRVESVKNQFQVKRDDSTDS